MNHKLRKDDDKLNLSILQILQLNFQILQIFLNTNKYKYNIFNFLILFAF